MKLFHADVETTGFVAGRDEILSVAIVPENGTTPVINTMIKPVRNTSWPQAQKVNGIAPGTVLYGNLPTWEMVARQIFDNPLFIGATIVTYNVVFDRAFIEHGRKDTGIEWECCMTRFANHMRYPKVSNNHQGRYRNFKLGDAMQIINGAWHGRAHGAYADAMACQTVWRYLDAYDGLNGEQDA